MFIIHIESNELNFKNAFKGSQNVKNSIVLPTRASYYKDVILIYDRYVLVSSC